MPDMYSKSKGKLPVLHTDDINGPFFAKFTNIQPMPEMGGQGVPQRREV